MAWRNLHEGILSATPLRHKDGVRANSNIIKTSDLADMYRQLITTLNDVPDKDLPSQSDTARLPRDYKALVNMVIQAMDEGDFEISDEELKNFVPSDGNLKDVYYQDRMTDVTGRLGTR